MRVAIIIGALCYLAGNILWEPLGEEKLYFVPQAVLILLLIIEVRKKTVKHLRIFFTYFMLLAAGNVVKELFYSYYLKQVNDYIFGGFMTLWLLYQLLKLWATQKQHSGKK